MNKILLFKTSVAWYARYEGPHAEQIQDLFGTKIIPTAYTADASAESVCLRVSELNPNVLVSIENQPRIVAMERR